MKTITSLKTKIKNTVIDDTIARFKTLGPQLPDKRTGKNCQYTMSDIILGAFAIFFLQCPSFLARQKAMQQQRGRSNTTALFSMERTPCDNHIRDMLLRYLIFESWAQLLTFMVIQLEIIATPDD